MKGLALIVLLALVAGVSADAPATSSSQEMVTRVYDVADVLVLPMEQRQTSSRASTSQPVPREMLSEAREAIMAAIAPDTWEGTSRGKGVIRASTIAQQLVVRQTPEVHKQIDAFLEKARAAQAIQVCVDAKFISVRKAALQEVGMDVAMSGRAEPMKPPPPGNRLSTSATTGPATQPQALTGCYLKESQVRFLVDHLSKSRGKTIASPSLMLMNGGEGMIRQMDSRRYVESVTPTTLPSGAVLYVNKQDQADDGVSLQVRANVSTDRKWVTLYLRPHMSRVLTMAVFTFKQAPFGAVMSIQEPVDQHIEVDTLVAVPDGDWVLLGGQTIAETWPKGPADDEQMLLILVRPRIVK